MPRPPLPCHTCRGHTEARGEEGRSLKHRNDSRAAQLISYQVKGSLLGADVVTVIGNHFNHNHKISSNLHLMSPVTDCFIYKLPET